VANVNDIGNFCLKKSAKYEKYNEAVEELDTNNNTNSNTEFAEVKAGFELFANFAKLNFGNAKLFKNIFEI